MLSKNLRTHYAILRDGRKIPLTKPQYDSIVLAKQDAKPSEFIKLEDADDKSTLYHGEISAIKEFEEIKRQDTSKYVFHCQYGTEHRLHETCECVKSQPNGK